MKTRTLALGMLAAAGVCAIERYGRRSGATREEGGRPLPGDDIAPRPLWASTRAITIEAPPDEVWPWVVQMGFPPHRAGWYTPHWLDVAMWGKRPRSADHIVSELQDLKVGDTVPDSADYSVFYEVDEIERPHHIVLHSVRHVFPPLKSSDFTWVFVLEDAGAGQTRFIIRARVAYRPLWALPMIELLLNAGDLVNASAMLRNVKKLAERGDGGAAASGAQVPPLT